LQLAVRSVFEIRTTRPVRALLLKGASRNATNKKDETCIDLIKPETPQQMLKVPRYIECFMIKTPLVPLQKNHKTQLLFIGLFLLILSTQILLVIPSKSSFAFLSV
jgi:hypothetical protein